MASTIYHALVLNLHQPAGNLEYLLETNEWEAKEILYALDRIPRSLWEYEDVARVHLTLSGTLLETLSSADFQSRVYGIMKCGDFLWHLQNNKIFDVIGTGYYHPVLPLIPKEDWPDQLERWLTIGLHLFYRNHFPGFWPPEMGFCMELIPLLKRLGYRYVLVDSHNVEPVTNMYWQDLRYRPHIARYENDEIIVVVRDRELSDAQESGMDFGWFTHEVHERTKWCDYPPLVTTCTDGDNGGWFRNTSAYSNFWNVFYQEMLDRARQPDSTISPIFINDYINRYGVYGEVKVRAAAWNTGWHHGVGFVQWTGSQTQKEALKRVSETSRAFHELKSKAVESNTKNQGLWRNLTEAQWHILRAETSCNFFWGESWVHRCHEDLDQAWIHLNKARLHKVT